MHSSMVWVPVVANVHEKLLTENCVLCTSPSTVQVNWLVALQLSPVPGVEKFWTVKGDPKHTSSSASMLATGGAATANTWLCSFSTQAPLGRAAIRVATTSASPVPSQVEVGSWALMMHGSTEQSWMSEVMSTWPMPSMSKK